jgi:hypothetical protein
MILREQVREIQIALIKRRKNCFGTDVWDEQKELDQATDSILSAFITKVEKSIKEMMDGDGGSASGAFTQELILKLKED